MNENFYKDLKSIDSFEKLLDVSNFNVVPEDWYILATDIVNSTDLIAKNRYKDVNFLASMTIIGILNINRQIDIPFVFGGDGAILLVPKSILQKSLKVLFDCKKLAKELYEIKLRTTFCSIQELNNNSLSLYLAKHRYSNEHYQAILEGSAISWIDNDIRQNDRDVENLMDKDYETSFEGLECRWNEIKTPKDETISIILKAKDNNFEVYSNIMNIIENIAGKYEERNPVRQESLNLTFSIDKLRTEVKLKAKTKIGQYLKYLQFIIQDFIGNIVFKYGPAQWQNYKARMLRTCDTEKYENMLKMVISTTYKETQEIEDYLEKQQDIGNLIYGMHKSDSALMTCLILQRHGKHVHFVDSSKGGYALAAKKLKEKITELKWE